MRGSTQSEEVHLYAVDLERRRAGIDCTEVARHFFSAAEAAELQRLPAAERSETFLRWWTRKEALLKATGEGVANGLAHVPGPEPAPRGWTVRDVALARGYVAAAAVEGTRAAIVGPTPVSEP